MSVPFGWCYATAMVIYFVLFAFDTLVVLAAGAFLAEETMTVIFPIVAIGLAGLIAASVQQAKGKSRLATLIVAILAVPPAGLVLFYGLVSATGGFHH